MRQINFVDEIIVDCFAGGGGWSTGVEQATGRVVDVAINHDPDAILMHKTNHPYTEHYQEDIFATNPQTVCRGRPVGWAHFSPDCKHFSRAKGKKPVNKKIRGLAWVALRWAGMVRPRIISLENVPEFKTWGPLNRQHNPIKSKKGVTFNKFVSQLRALGYEVDFRELTACDYGAPTTRTRFFLIARCDGKPIVWPEKTHGPGLIPYRSAADIIDWSIPCTSIFGRKKPLCDKTMRRIARGIKKFVVDDPSPFVMQAYGGGYSGAGRSVEDPLPTVTAIDHNYLVSPVISAIGQQGFSDDRSRSVTDPLSTIVTKQEHILITPFLSQYHSYEDAARGGSIKDPVLTIDTSNRYALLAPYMMHYYGTSTGAKETDPVGTITANGQHIAQVQVFLKKYQGGAIVEGNGGSSGINKNRGSRNHGNRRNMEEEKNSFTRRNSSDNSEESREPSQKRVPGREDMLQGFGVPDSRSSNCMDGSAGGNSGEYGHQPQGREEDKQFSGEFGDCNAQCKSESRDINGFENVSEFSKGSFSGGKDAENGRDVILDDSKEAANITDDCISCHSFVMKYYGQGTGQSLTNPLDTVVTKDRFGLVMVYGELYQIIDILMRMLTPRELYNAQGFPPDYIIDHDYTGKSYPKDKQVARCGNAVPPPFASALFRANWPEICKDAKIETMDEVKQAITA